MLAEIIMLRLEVMARTSKESITRSTSQFVPVTLPAAPSTPTSDSSIRAALTPSGSKRNIDCPRRRSLRGR